MYIRRIKEKYVGDTIYLILIFISNKLIMVFLLLNHPKFTTIELLTWCLPSNHFKDPNTYPRCLLFATLRNTTSKVFSSSVRVNFNVLGSTEIKTPGGTSTWATYVLGLLTFLTVLLIVTGPDFILGIEIDG